MVLLGTSCPEQVSKPAAAWLAAIDKARKMTFWQVPLDAYHHRQARKLPQPLLQRDQGPDVLGRHSTENVRYCMR